MTVIAVTGGVASGKSTFAARLAHYLGEGAQLVSVDDLVARVWEERPPALMARVASILDGEPTRERAREVVFADARKRAAVEEAFSDYVTEHLEAALDAPTRFDVLEFPTLAQHGTQDTLALIDEILDLDVWVGERKRRAIERGWTAERFEVVNAAQLNEGQRIAKLRTMAGARIAVHSLEAGTLSADNNAAREANRLKLGWLAWARGHGRPRVGVFAGSFDPITRGHEALIERASQLVDFLLVAVAQNPEKRTLFDQDHRHMMARHAVGELSPAARARTAVVYLPPDELLVSWARDQGAAVIFRGLRDGTDFDYEHRLHMLQEAIAPEVTVTYLMPPRHLAEASSSLVRGVRGLKGWEAALDRYVSPPVMAELRALKADR